MSKDSNKDVKVPVRSYSEEQEEKLFRYYNKNAHEAAFKVPTFVRKALQESAS